MKKKTEHISHDTLLDFLDRNSGFIGATIVAADPDYWPKRTALLTLQHKIRLSSIAKDVIENASRLDSAARSKAQVIQEALLNSPIPACPADAHCETHSIWHHEVIHKEHDFIKSKDVITSYGTVDWALNIRLNGIEFCDYSFFAHLAPSAKAKPGATDDPFQRWLMSVDPKACSTHKGKEWRIRPIQKEIVYFFCAPDLKDRSALVKRIQPLRRMFPSRVYICSNIAPELLETLSNQSFGTFRYPNGSIVFFNLKEDADAAPKPMPSYLGPDEFRRPWDPSY